MLAAYSFAVVDQALARPRHVPGTLQEDSRDHPAPAPGTRPHPSRPSSTPRCSCCGRWACPPPTWLAAPQAGRRSRPSPSTSRSCPPLVTDGSRRAYGSYWNRVTEQWGEPAARRAHAVGDPAADVLRQDPRGAPAATPAAGAAPPSTSSPRCAACTSTPRMTGSSARRRTPPGRWTSPAACPPPAGPSPTTGSPRSARPPPTAGDDPELDTLLLRLHTETACRRGGALALRPDDLDSGQCLIRLREKGETVRWQPVSPTLMAAPHRARPGAARPARRAAAALPQRAADHLPPL